MGLKPHAAGQLLEPGAVDVQGGRMEAVVVAGIDLGHRHAGANAHRNRGDVGARTAPGGRGAVERGRIGAEITSAGEGLKTGLAQFAIGAEAGLVSAVQ